MEGLLVKNKSCLIHGSCPRESALLKQCARQDRCNAIVKAWIHNTVTKDLASGLVYNTTARYFCDGFCNMFNKVDTTRIFQLTHNIYYVTQGTLSITAQFDKSKMLWGELTTIDDLVLVCEEDNTLISASKERQKLIQFLLGLNENFAFVRTNLLLKQLLSNLHVAYSATRRNTMFSHQSSI